jgi:HD-like signal output (HDOD) protein
LAQTLKLITSRNEPPVEGIDSETTSLSHLVEQVSGLVTPPGVAVELFNAVQSPRANARSIAHVLSHDPSLSAKVLRIANSAFYGLPRSVTSVSQAVTMLGFRELSALVTAVSATRSFAGIRPDTLNVEQFWQHSLLTGLIAKSIALQLPGVCPETSFVAGLMHDIGVLIMANAHPAYVSAVAERLDGTERAMTAVENQIFGYEHAEVGGALLERWDLPSPLPILVRYHHAPDLCESELAARVIRLSELLASLNESGALYPTPERRDEASSAAIRPIESIHQMAMLEFAEVARLSGRLLTVSDATDDALVQFEEARAVFLDGGAGRC